MSAVAGGVAAGDIDVFVILRIRSRLQRYSIGVSPKLYATRRMRSMGAPSFSPGAGAVLVGNGRVTRSIVLTMLMPYCSR